MVKNLRCNVGDNSICGSGESHGQRCLVGYRPCSCRESDRTELRVEDFLREEHSRQRTQRYQSSEVGHVYLRKGNRISLTAAD